MAALLTRGSMYCVCSQSSSNDRKKEVRQKVEENVGKFVKEFRIKRKERIDKWRENTSDFFAVEVEKTVSFHNDLVSTISDIRRDLESEDDSQPQEEMNIQSYKDKNDDFFTQGRK
jgi:hypothetical protein